MKEIKTQDLRVGNYIFDETGLFSKVTKIDAENKLINEGKLIFKGAVTLLFDKNIGSSATWIEKCKPIRITEDWLLRLGFNKNSSTFYNDTRISLHQKDDYDYFLCEIDNIVIRELKTIHQLQNLYYSLTGEELTIKK